MSRNRCPKRSQAIQRAAGGCFVEPAVFIEARGEAHHLAQAIEDDELAVRIARDDHVETVRSQIDSRHDVRRCVLLAREPGLPDG